MSGGTYRDILVFAPGADSISCPLQLLQYGSKYMWTARVLWPSNSKPSYCDRTYTLLYTEEEESFISPEL